MTLRELGGELEKINLELQKLRRTDYEIPGDPAFSAAMRQCIIVTLGEVRIALDDMVSSFDRVQDVESIMKGRPGLMARIQKALGSGEEPK